MIISYQDLMSRFPPFLVKKNLEAMQLIQKVNEEDLLLLCDIANKVYREPCIILTQNLKPYASSLLIAQDDYEGGEFGDRNTQILFDLARFCAVYYQDVCQQGVIPLLVNIEPPLYPAVLGVVHRSLSFTPYVIKDLDSPVFSVFS